MTTDPDLPTRPGFPLSYSSSKTSSDPFGLTTDETLWVALQPFLLSRGYKLRPRYEPGWIGSWKVNSKSLTQCEDLEHNRRWNVLDAIRLVDGVKVVLKIVATETEEIPISLYLSSEALRNDSRNHVVHILDVIPFPDGDTLAFLVMPFLREFDDPSFRVLAEFIEALQQIFESLALMHEHNIAHRDACYGNIMMDTSRLIPGGFHHVKRHTSDGVHRFEPKLKTLSRLSVAPVNYYIIDFGLSSRFASDAENVLVTGVFGQNKKVPELSNTVPYDPFKVDIYQVGGVIKKLIRNYRGVKMFRPLVKTMSHHEPMQRLTAAEALQQFEAIVSRLGPQALKRRVVLYEDWLPTKTWRHVRSAVQPDWDPNWSGSDSKFWKEYFSPATGPNDVVSS